MKKTSIEANVSCQVLGMMFVVCDEKQIDVDEVLAGLPYSRAHIETPSNFIDWNSLAKITNRIAAHVSEDELLNLAKNSYKHPLFAIYKLIGRLRFNLRGQYFYMLGAEGLAATFYPLTSELLEDDEDKRFLKFRVTIPEPYDPCPNFLKILEGQAIGIPEVLGYRPSSVEASYLERAVEFSIKLPPERGFLALLRKIIRYPVDAFSASRTLEETHRLLVERNRDLELETRRLKELHEAMNFQQSQLGLLEEHLSVLLWSIDLKMRPQYYSPSVERMFGYTVDEAMQLPPMGLLVEEEKEKAYDMLVAALKDEEAGNRIYGSRTLRARQVGRDGKIKWCENHMSFMRNSEGEAIGIVGVVIDIDDQVAQEKHQALLEKQLHESRHRESLGQLAGGIAHDFNNSLQSIIGHSELALRSDDMGKRDELLSEILRGATSTAGLVGQLLAMSRQQPVNRQVIELEHWLKQMSPMMRSLLHDGIKLEMDVPGGLYIYGDPSQLERVLMNLALNARDAMPEGGVFRITAELLAAPDVSNQVSSHIKLLLQDTGIGIEAPQLRNVFNPYFTTKAQSKGTGLGLAVTKGIVEQHGGTIEIRSTPNVGTQFEILIPAADKESVEQQSTKHEVRNTSGSGLILVVDDRESIREVAGSILRASGYEVIEAENGEDAVDSFRARQDAIDLVLMDIIMPEMNGDKAAEIMREIRPDTKFLFMTGYAGDEQVVTALADQKAAILNKPFRLNALLEKVDSMLEEAST